MRDLTRWIGLVLLIVTASQPALAADEEKSEDRLRLESFQRVAFGWFMDTRCANLSAAEAIAFEWHFETAFGVFKDEANLVDIAEIIRESAEEAASSGRYDCTPEMAELTRNASTEAGQLVAALGKGPFDIHTSYPELLSAYLANAAAAAAIESRCALLAPPRRRLLIEGYQDAAQQVTERFGPQAVERAETAAKATAATIARAHCTEAMRPFLASLFTDLERLRRGLVRLDAADP